MKPSRKLATQRRHSRIRRKVVGTGERPRLAVFRSNQHIYAQVIDDVNHHTLVSASTVEPTIKAEVVGNTCDASIRVGQLLAERAASKGIASVVFDRGGKLYHGRVKALADAARQSGLQF
ncbi:MAG: 50S ribosomal protein L18 [Cyanothece sp. SIO2G6]|nr:50S ribosomal protein L18 [Cyanothece sp. SIO2G6]